MEGLTKEQYAEILSNFERATWYLKCAAEKLEKYLPDPPKPAEKPVLCLDCKKPTTKSELYCGPCADARK